MQYMFTSNLDLAEYDWSEGQLERPEPYYPESREVGPEHLVIWSEAHSTCPIN